MLKKFIAIAAMLILGSALAEDIDAQAKAGKTNARYFQMIQMAKEGKSVVDSETAQRVRDFYDGSTRPMGNPHEAIVGTWNCVIPESNGGAPPFEALQTFSSDGTFVETSSLFGGGGEGPAHGVWLGSHGSYLLTFELFVFDPSTGVSVGRVRVRNVIQMQSKDSFRSDTLVDFIDLDGTVIAGIDGGPFTATRMKVQFF